jgi:hypothetical protein
MIITILACAYIACKVEGSTNLGLTKIKKIGTKIGTARGCNRAREGACLKQIEGKAPTPQGEPPKRF